MLFGLCCLVGMRLAAKKTERLSAIRAVQRDLRLFSERIDSGNCTLVGLASAEQEGLFGMLSAYLGALTRGESEERAAESAVSGFTGNNDDRISIAAFLNGVSSASQSDIRKRADALKKVLSESETDAQAEAKQARVLRVSGVLVGAGLAILLL